MDTTTRSTDRENQTKRPSLFRRIFGGEFLLSKEMRPWYFYFAMIFLFAIALIVSQQRAISKEEKIDKLDSQYKETISHLKANNQFIPYEENQMLIQKMQERGYVLDEEHTFTIAVHNTDTTAKHHFFNFKGKHGKGKK